MGALDRPTVAAILAASVSHAVGAGIPWESGEMRLEPAPKLLELIDRSRKVAVASLRMRADTGPPDDKFAIEVHFLTGRFVATCHNDRRAGEWPPHPARLFSALVAAWAEAEEPDHAERPALEWLEGLGAPAIAASDAVPRRTVSHFVPVNDTSVVERGSQEKRTASVYELSDRIHEALIASGGEVTSAVGRLQERLADERNVAKAKWRAGREAEKAAAAMLPEGRGKQERAFPSMVPNGPQVTYVWTHRGADAPTVALDRLLERVTRLGHSSSLVSCRVVSAPPDPTFVVSTDGSGTPLRTVQRGQLAELERRFARHQGYLPRALPYTPVHYQAVEGAPAETLLAPDTVGDWIVFEFAHNCRAFPVTRCVEFASAVRAAILAHAEDPIPEAISGHQPDGRPTLSPHVATVPIPHVASPHADGRMLGIALSVPSSMGGKSRTALHRAVGIWERSVLDDPGRREAYLALPVGSRGQFHLRRVIGIPELKSLRSAVWKRPSRRWLSATPVALPRHPGSLTRGSHTVRAKAWERAESAVRQACEHVGLPDPSEVNLSLDPMMSGARRVADFPPFRQAGREGEPVRRQLIHASLTFHHRVCGPFLLGAGRFFGLGLMRPFRERSEPGSAKEKHDG